jgi:alkanesulfonate monooxygenase SsuD/methylene tetrahydromethanopterin reductase-like flavin-dependent oxidoreductase (luciferase family)
MTGVPLSVLDLAPISADSDAATALRNTIDLAQHAERWGYRRFWVTEHHFVGVASSSPAVLVGQIVASTNTIRVGSAAVQLSHTTTTAAAVVESFGMLEAFHPGPIGLGMGRSGQRRITSHKPRKPRPKTETLCEWREIDGVAVPPPFDLRSVLNKERVQAAMAMLQQPEAVAPDFAEQLNDIIAMLNGSYRVDGFDVHAVPGERSGLTPWIFGSSKGTSAQMAGALDAVDAYRAAFVPSATLSRPYVVISADIVVADDSATARHLAQGRVRHGDPIAVARRYRERTAAEKLSIRELVIAVTSRQQFVGTASRIADEMNRYVQADACDGFILVPHLTPHHLDDFVDQVVPLLQERGVYRTEYTGRTLRENLNGQPAMNSW